MNHTALVKQLDFLSSGLGLEITFKGAPGIYHRMDKGLQLALLPYTLHCNSYCEYIKKSKLSTDICKCMAPKIERKCRVFRKAFVGTCYAGVVEYIIPIFSKSGEYLGFFTVGSFRHDNKIGSYLVNKALLRLGLSAETGMNRYMQLPSELPYTPYTLDNGFSLVLQYFKDVLEQQKVAQESNLYLDNFWTEDPCLGRIVQVVTRNYRDELKVSSIAKACSCSESYINHSFKAKTGISISNFINWYRVGKAMELLVKSRLDVTKIALEVGFSDANYFTKVFKSFYGQTPTDFRKRNQIT